jgi:hypothetical protein
VRGRPFVGPSCYRAVQFAQPRDLCFRLPLDALFLVPERVDQRPKRCEASPGISLDRRDLVWINVTTNPTAEWVARQITEAFPWDGLHAM